MGIPWPKNKQPRVMQRASGRGLELRTLNFPFFQQGGREHQSPQTTTQTFPLLTRRGLHPVLPTSPTLGQEALSVQNFLCAGKKQNEQINPPMLIFKCVRWSSWPRCPGQEDQSLTCVLCVSKSI